jgi:uncharacterized protein (DUF1697 family)
VKKFSADIDIDFADRDQILQLIKHTPAAMIRDDQTQKHNTGVYVNPIPADPFSGFSNIDYQQAEDLGYVKLDLLNVNVYRLIKNEQHLKDLIATEPMWEMLEHKEFVQQIIHINNHYDLLKKMPEPVNSIARMAMFLSIIRPAKRNLAGLPWSEVAKTVWGKPSNDAYFFKKSHAISYSQLVAVHMNLLVEFSD